MQNIISGHLLKAPKPVTQLNPQLDPKIDEVLHLALNKQRDERIGSALEFGEALKAVIMGSCSVVVTPKLIPVAAGALRNSGQVLATLADTNPQISSSRQATLIVPPSAIVEPFTTVVPPATVARGRVTEKVNAQLATEIFANGSLSALATDPDTHLTLDGSIMKTQKVVNNIPETLRIPMPMASLPTTSSRSSMAAASLRQSGKILVAGGIIGLLALVGAYKGLVAVPSAIPANPAAIVQPKEITKSSGTKNQAHVIEPAETDPATTTPTSEEGNTPTATSEPENRAEDNSNDKASTEAKNYKPTKAESKSTSSQARSESAYRTNHRRQENDDDNAGRAIKNVGGAVVHGVKDIKDGFKGLFGGGDKKDKKDKRH